METTTWTTIKKLKNKSTSSKCSWGCGEKGTFEHCWWESRLMQSLWKTVWSFLKKLEMELLYDTKILFLKIYPKNPETLFWKNICTSVFIAVLLTSAKTWKQPKCPPGAEWIKKLWHIYTAEYHLTIKKELIFCHRMKGPGEYYMKWNKPVRQRQILYDFTYIWSQMNKII